MAYKQIPNLPAAIALNGTEELEAVQAGTSVRTTTGQIASLAGPAPTVLLNVPPGTVLGRFVGAGTGIAQNLPIAVDASGNVGIGTSSPGYKFDVNGSARISNIGGASQLEIGDGQTSNQFAFIDLVGDTTYSDYGLRIIRGNTGANTTSEIVHRGTGALALATTEAAPILLNTNSTERMRITSSGDVGIGTSSPSQVLQVRKDTASAAGAGVIVTNLGGNQAFFTSEYGTGGVSVHKASYFTNSSEHGMYGEGAVPYVFYTNTNERMRITSAGNVGIGTSSPNYKLQVNPSSTSGSNFHIEDYDSGSGGANRAVISVTEAYNNDTYGDGFASHYARGTAASPLAIQSGDVTGYFYGRGYDGTSFRTFSWMEFPVDGAVSTGVMPLAIKFVTGSSSAAERMRITSAGNVLIGNTNGVNKLDVTGSFGRGAPVTKTADFTLADTENWVINNKSGSSCTVTLPAASSWTGREVMFKTIQAQTLVSASSNVVPLDGGSAGTAILAGTAGKWATLVSDGTNWVIMAGN